MQFKTNDDVQKYSAGKVKQIQDLMGVLKVEAHAKQRVNENGIIEGVVFYMDRETYTVEEAEKKEVSIQEISPIEKVVGEITEKAKEATDMK